MPASNLVARSGSVLRNRSAPRRFSKSVMALIRNEVVETVAYQA